MVEMTPLKDMTAQDLYKKCLRVVELRSVQPETGQLKSCTTTFLSTDQGLSDELARSLFMGQPIRESPTQHFLLTVLG